MNNIQEKVKDELGSRGIPYAQNVSISPDVLSGSKNGLPPEVIHTIRIFEEKVFELTSIQGEYSGLLAHPERDRAGLPIMLLPQRRDKHEFDVLTHCVITAWAISQFWRVIYPKLPVQLKTAPIIDRLANDSSSKEGYVIPWTLAAYFHDVEKIFERRRPIDNNSPAVKSADTDKAKVALLQTPTGEDFTTMQIIGSLFGKQKSDLPIDGLLEDISVDQELAITLMRVYSIVDQLIINHAEAGQVLPFQSLVNEAIVDINKITSEVMFQCMGILIMAADNYAQGLPPILPPGQETTVIPNVQTLADEFIHERIRNYQIVNTLLVSLLS